MIYEYEYLKQIVYISPFADLHAFKLLNFFYLS